MDNSMKITVGLGSIDEYERFVQAGADEFFCGYVPFSWAEKYGTVMPLNRREVLCYNVQLGAYSELEILSRMVKKYKKPVHLTFNSLYYIPEQYPEIGDIIEKCMEIGFRSYIIALEMNKKLHSEAVDQLFEAILCLKNKEECYTFFEDVCTINELLSLSQRFEVAKMLREKRTYLEISEKTGASTATFSPSQ